MYCNEEKFFRDDDSLTIQAAIDEAEKSLDKTVVIPKLNKRTNSEIWVISQAVLLPNDITVILDGCHLILKDGIFDNMFRNKNTYTELGLKPEGEQYNIKILGKNDPILDGGKDNGLREQLWTPDKPSPRTGCLILLSNVKDYEIKDITCIQMRYWAIFQLACRNGYLGNIKFDAKIRHPNQDGINFRIGCHHITCENISGYTGDDTIALTALPLWHDKDLLPQGRKPDINDITIKNISSSTNCTVVALRNVDGAKMFNINIENIFAHDDGTHKPWGAVRIGENNWYKNRPAVYGEVDNIHVKNVKAEINGCIFLASSLTNSTIKDVYATGKSMYAISTYQSVQKFWETDCDILPGVDMENVSIENIRYDGTAEYKDNLEDRYMELTFPNEKFNGCAIDLRCLRDNDKLKNVTVKNVTTKGKIPKLLLKEGYSLKVE